jgi:hypothetical protein
MEPAQWQPSPYLNPQLFATTSIKSEIVRIHSYEYSHRLLKLTDFSAGRTEIRKARPLQKESELGKMLATTAAKVGTE